MEDILRRVFRVSTANEQTDEISFYLHSDSLKRNKTPVVLQTGDKGCKINEGDIIVISRKSAFIKILAQACIRGCKATECKITKCKV